MDYGCLLELWNSCRRSIIPAFHGCHHETRKPRVRGSPDDCIGKTAGVAVQKPSEVLLWCLQAHLRNASHISFCQLTDRVCVLTPCLSACAEKVRDAKSRMNVEVRPLRFRQSCHVCGCSCCPPCQAGSLHRSASSRIECLQGRRSRKGPRLPRMVSS